MITVIGLGFVGLTTAVGFAHFGYEVCGVEKNQYRRSEISQKRLPFYEPGLDEALVQHMGGNFNVADNFESVGKSEYVFLCVGTPCGENGEADLTDLFKAIDECIEHLGNNAPILIVKSTVPPSTTFGKIKEYIKSKGLEIGRDIYLANNPEFLREGYCWQDFTEPGRIVVGVEDDYVRKKMTELYEPFNAPIRVVTGNTAEFIKYVSNSFLATMISFSNEMAEVADAIGDIQIGHAFKILHEDERWGGCNMTSYLYPGCGYGGYCLPKDTVALSNIARANDVETKILNQVIERNNDMSKSIARRISKHVDKDQAIGILGLSFKPGSDDVRETSSYKIMKELAEMGYNNFVAYDPLANKAFKETYNIAADVEYKETLSEAYKAADILVILTAWPEFKELKNKSLDKEILDYRYLL